MRDALRSSGAIAHDVPTIARGALGDTISALRPDWGAPLHLAPYLDVWRRIDEGEPVRVLLSVPPRHWKSQTTLCGLARHIARHPDRRNVYATYGEDLSRTGSRTCRRYVRDSMRIELSAENNRLDDWATIHGGGLYATGIGGALTGKGIDGVAIVDDPVKNREEAESPKSRARILAWFGDVLMTRLERNAAVIVIMTRWHPDDLVGTLAKRGGWEMINIPAIRNVNGRDVALLPKYPDGSPAYPIKRLREIERELGAYSFAALYQGAPRPKGGAVFDPPTTCGKAHVPKVGSYSIGIDLAYTTQTYSDYSTAVTLMRANMPLDSRTYVVDVSRLQVRPEQMINHIQALKKRYPGAPVTLHGNAQEVGAAKALTALGLEIRAKKATSDKYVRAQDVAAAWNSGKIVVPHDAHWSSAFINEVTGFTGVGDTYDDQVDALVSAYSSIGKNSAKARVSGSRTFGKASRKAY